MQEIIKKFIKKNNNNYNTRGSKEGKSNKISKEIYCVWSKFRKSHSRE